MYTFVVYSHNFVSNSNNVAPYESRILIINLHSRDYVSEGTTADLNVLFSAEM